MMYYIWVSLYYIWISLWALIWLSKKIWRILQLSALTEYGLLSLLPIKKLKCCNSMLLVRTFYSNNEYKLLEMQLSKQNKRKGKRHLTLVSFIKMTSKYWNLQRSRQPMYMNDLSCLYVHVLVYAIIKLTINIFLKHYWLQKKFNEVSEECECKRKIGNGHGRVVKLCICGARGSDSTWISEIGYLLLPSRAMTDRF